MKKKLDIYLFYYLFVLLIFSYFFLFIKHKVGNDSTISEWLINFEGGFTKRGIIGQLAIELSRIFDSNLRWTIFLMQSFVCTTYFLFLYRFLKDFLIDRILILSIFSPIFILYPIAEIEVLARKEIIVFTLFLIYFFIPRENSFKLLSLTLLSTLSILVWEPIIFFFPLLIILEIVENKITKLNLGFFRIILCFLPSLIFAFVFITNPLTVNEHDTMSLVLKNEFGEICYMSCALLKIKSSVFDQFRGNFGLYTFEAVFRYTLIILLGFYPLFTLVNNSVLKSRNLLFFCFFNKPSSVFIICLSPALLLFIMGYDWGRWVNISYVISALIYFKLLKSKELSIDFNEIKKSFLYKINKTKFVILFLIFCFGWNPKTVMLGDVASFPGYRIPYKAFKILSN